MDGKFQWTRTEAERSIGKILDSARSGVSQTIAEKGGEYIVRFVPDSELRESAARILARGGPGED